MKKNGRHRGRINGCKYYITPGDFAVTLLILVLTTLVGAAVYYDTALHPANIVTIYIAGVLITSIVTSGWICSLISSVASVVVFSFFFAEPRFSFLASGSEYPVTFAVMFAVALLSGILASRLKDQARQSEALARRTEILFETNQMLQKVETEQEIMKAAAGQIEKLLHRTVVVYREDEGKLLPPEIYPTESEDVPQQLLNSREESSAAALAMKQEALSKKVVSKAGFVYFGLRAGEHSYGAVGVRTGKAVPEDSEYSVLLSILGECVLALENRKNAREKEQAAFLAKSEQLRADLLRAISHDLRTPLTSISGNASNLLSNGDRFDADSRQQIYRDIYDDSMWLISLVENLLAVTRFEEGKVNLRITTELVDEVISEALHHLSRKDKEHTITVENSEKLLLAQMDGRLIVQVIINLVDNAIKYTPSGSHIHISARELNGMVEISVADDGPGVPDEQKQRIFDMFYTGNYKIADSRRSLGLGLALCRSIVHAHGGEIRVNDHVPHGAVFTFTLPCREVTIHE